MSETVSRLLATFESLSENEQHELLIVMLRRTGEMPDTAVTDDELSCIADTLFQALDVEESDGNNAESR